MKIKMSIQHFNLAIIFFLLYSNRAYLPSELLLVLYCISISYKTLLFYGIIFKATLAYLDGFGTDKTMKRCQLANMLQLTHGSKMSNRLSRPCVFLFPPSVLSGLL